MTITYVNDLRLSEMATGDNSGTWGTVTNTNLELIGEALGYGTEAITTNADTHASVIADGATDPVRALYVEYTGTLDSACTITISPNTVNKVCFIENGTAGSQNIIISQGSGANVTIPPGDTKAVYLNGAGSGAAVVDAFASLSVVDLKVQDALSVTGVLTTTAATVFNGGFTANAASTISTDGNEDTLVLKSNDADANSGPKLQFNRNSANPADGDDLGEIRFSGRNDAGQAVEYLKIYTEIIDASDGTEDGRFTIDTMLAGTSVDRMQFNSAETIFNQDSADLDFRVESNASAAAFFVDGGTNRVSIGTSSADAPFHVKTDDINTALFQSDSSTGAQVFIRNSTATAGVYAQLGLAPANNVLGGSIIVTADEDFSSSANRTAHMELQTRHDGTNRTRLYLDESNTVFNEESRNTDFRVEGDGEASLFFADASKDRIGVGTQGLADGASGSGDNHGILMVRDNTYPVASIQRNAVSATDGNYTALVLNVETTGTPAAGLASGMRYLVDGSIVAETAGFNNGTYEVRTCAAGGSLVPKMHIGTTATIFNEDSADIDFRIESNNNTHALFVQGSDGNVAIGSSTPEANTNFVALTIGPGASTGGGQLYVESSSVRGVFGSDNNGSDPKTIVGTTTDHPLVFFQNNSDVGRFDDDGSLLIGKSAASNTTKGTNISPNGAISNVIKSDDTGGASQNILLNRQDADGTYILFRQGGGNEGTISVSGSTVSYNGFSGRHESSGIATNTAIGTVVSTIDELDVYSDTQGSGDDKETNPKSGQTRADHAKVEVSTSVGDSCVYGVVSEFDSNGKLIVTSVGIGSIRVTGACAKGDLLESNGDGTAKVQSDDIVRSKTLGKVTIGNSNTGVKLVSCVMYCG